MPYLRLAETGSYYTYTLGNTGACSPQEHRPAPLHLRRTHVHVLSILGETSLFSLHSRGTQTHVLSAPWKHRSCSPRPDLAGGLGRSTLAFTGRGVLDRLLSHSFLLLVEKLLQINCFFKVSCKNMVRNASICYKFMYIRM